MKTGIVIAALAFGAQAELPMSTPPKAPQVAAVCFKSGESRSGMNKICYYNCMGSQAAITISSTSLCPLSINR